MEHTDTMPQILVAGAATGCWTNLGDEAILAGMVASLGEAIPGAELVVVSSSPAGFFARHGCGEVRYDDLDALAAAVEASDLVLLGGGSIFFDYWGCAPATVLSAAHQGLALWASVALLAATADVPVMVYAAGVGPLRTADGELLARTVFELASDITLRDADAQRALDRLARDGEAPFPASDIVTATVTADPALAVDLPDAPVAPEDGPVVAVALRPWEDGVDPGWPAEVAGALDAFVVETGATVRFVPCHRPVEWPLTDDGAAAEAVRAAMAHADRTEMVDVEVPWAERAALFGAADLAVAMRYHASLFALAAGVPAVGLGYDPKVGGLFADWGLDDLFLPMAGLDAHTLLDVMRRTHQDRARWSARAGDAVAPARIDAGETARRAARLLAEGPVSRPAGPATRTLLARRVRSGPDGRLLGRVRDRLLPRPRVALLTNRLLDRETGEPCIGGAERYALELARLLHDLGCDPTFFQREGAWGEADYFGFPVVALPRGEEFQEFEIGVAGAFLERTAEFDHVLCLMPNYASGPLREDAIVVCHGVWWDHDLWGHLEFRTPEWYEHLERVFTRPRRLVSVDNNSISVVRALYPDAAARMTCIPNAVDTERFVPPPARPDRIPEVVFPRRADVIRGPQLVGPVLAEVPDPCRVRWVGEGDPGLLDDLRAVAASDGRLEVTTASFDEMPEVLGGADIVVIPTVASEGQSLACLEAMAAGCAVVVTRVGGLPELVTDGVDGFVCDPTAGSIGAALRRLVRDPALRARLGAAARRRAETHSLARWRAQWAQVFAEEGWVDARTAAAAADPYDIVCFGIIDWRYRWQRPQQMMTAWARRGRRVFHVHIGDFLPPGGDPVAVEPLAEGVWEVRLALPEGYDVYAGNHPAGFVEAGIAGLDALRERFGIERAVSVVELATWEPLATAAREAHGWPVVYDCMDDWSTFPGFADTPAFLRCEEDLVTRADRVVVSARTIQRRWESRRPDVLLARNAVDFDFYQRDPGVDPLPDITGPVAGFFGAIVEWFDTELLTAVAGVRPEVTFVLAGGVQRTDVSALEALPNVRFLGHQPYAALPALLRRFDACLVPFRVSPVTDGMDVVKFYEYVSLGKPVVSTPIAEIVPYADLLYLADGPDAFGAALDAALVEDDPVRRERRVRLAASNTWDERLDRIEEAVLVPARPSSADVVDALQAELRRWRTEADECREQATRWQAEAEAARDAEHHLRAAVEAYERSRVLRPAHAYWRARRALDARRAPGERPPAAP